MSLDTSKLNHVQLTRDGKIIAQCPACAGTGADSKGNHLVIFPDGKFGCVVDPSPSHRREIYKLAALPVNARGVAPVEIKPIQIPKSVVKMVLGRLGRVNLSSEEKKYIKKESLDSPPSGNLSTRVDQHPSEPSEN